jgi:hypothetical protein
MKSNKVGSYQQLNEMWYQDINQALGDFNTITEETIDEMGGVKNIGDKAKLATPNARPNLGRHRSSDMLDKISKKDHDKNTVVGAKAAAYKAPHMKEGEANDTLMAFATKVSDEINDAYQDKFDSKKANIDQEEYTPEEMYKYISEWAESNDLTPEEAIKEFNWRHLTQELGLGLHEDMENDISNIKEAEDDIFAGSDKAKWDNYGNETSEWDTEIAGQTVKGWTAEETQGGAIAWENPKYPNAHIYATPGWEGVDGIAFELHDSEDGYMDEPKIQKVIGSGTEAWKTKKGYMALMAKAFTVVEKMLTPSKDMAEDYMGTQYGSSEDMAADMVNKGIKEDDGTGRQINHDFNDDISIDPSEFEDTISEGIQDYNHTWEYDIVDLLDDGVSKPEILTHFTDILKIARSSMGESIENEDPFGSIKTGIDKITQGDDEDFIDDDKLDRFYEMGGRQLTKAADALLDDGFSKREIIDYLQNYM